MNGYVYELNGNIYKSINKIPPVESNILFESDNFRKIDLFYNDVKNPKEDTEDSVKLYRFKNKKTGEEIISINNNLDSWEDRINIDDYVKIDNEC